DLGEKGADDGLCFRRLAGNQLFGDLQRHALHVAENRSDGQADSRKNSPRAVAGYDRSSGRVISWNVGLTAKRTTASPASDGVPLTSGATFGGIVEAILKGRLPTCTAYNWWA